MRNILISYNICNMVMRSNIVIKLNSDNIYSCIYRSYSGIYRSYSSLFKVLHELQVLQVLQVIYYMMC